MLEIVYRKTDELIPYANNSRTHTNVHVSQVAASIKEFGFTNPILIDEEGGIIAGHGRVMAAEKLKLDEVPTITLVGLTDAQKKAYVIADNKLALNSGWDEDLLKVELEGLRDDGYDLDVIGFSSSELDKLLGMDDDNPYEQKITAPTYQPTGIKPDLSDLYNDDKVRNLITEIEASSLPADEKAFLMAAAGRHVVLNFENIAEYYAHSSKECQELFENNALVIIDFNKAIELGYIRMCLDVNEAYSEEHPDA